MASVWLKGQCTSFSRREQRYGCGNPDRKIPASRAIKMPFNWASKILACRTLQFEKSLITQWLQCMLFNCVFCLAFFLWDLYSFFNNLNYLRKMSLEGNSHWTNCSSNDSFESQGQLIIGDKGRTEVSFIPSQNGDLHTSTLLSEPLSWQHAPEFIAMLVWKKLRNLLETWPGFSKVTHAFVKNQGNQSMLSCSSVCHCSLPTPSKKVLHSQSPGEFSSC